MSPARRLLLLGTGTAVLLVLAVVAAAVLLTRDPPREDRDAVAQDRPGTVVLIPGYGGSTVSLDALAKRLRTEGREAVVVQLPGDGTGDLRAQVPVVDAAVQTALQAGAPSVDIVGYSAGGIVARLYESGDGADVTRRVVTLGSPHHGTEVAALAARFAPGDCPEACQQLVPGSALLDDLNAVDETPDGPQWLSLWTSVDQVVTPPDTARLDGASNVVLQELCPASRTAHGQLPRDRAVQGVVLAALGAQPIAVPQGCPGAAAAG